MVKKSSHLGADFVLESTSVFCAERSCVVPSSYINIEQVSTSYSGGGMLLSE